MIAIADPRDIPIVLGLEKQASIFSCLMKKNFGMAIKKIYETIIAWIRFTIWCFIGFWVAFLFHCSKPEGDTGCISAKNNGLDNSIAIKMSDFVGAGNTPSNNNYTEGGQRTNWIDTGFITNGKPLIIYASGEYYPWGKNQTEKITGYHTNVRIGEDGEFTTSLQVTDDYQECEFNTDHKYYNDDTEQMRVAYADHLTNYTGQNKNNRLGGVAYALSQLGMQFDCIVGNNCYGGRIVNSNNQIEYPTGCVLKNGAGLYIRIGGDDIKYAYHLKNHYVPLLEKNCLLGDEQCEWKYKDKTLANGVQLALVPFSLPIHIYNQERQEFKIIEDIRDNLITDLTPITEYVWKEDRLAFKFTTLQQVSSNTCERAKLTDPTKYQTINDACFESVVKEMTQEELHNVYCPTTKQDVLHPNELCPPQEGKRIWVKSADTFYEDDEGNITLTFASGAVKENKNISYARNGFKLSWLQTVAYALLEPVWGGQVESAPASQTTEIKQTDIGDKKTIEICHKNGKNLYYTIYGNNYLIKTAKYASSGLVFKMSDTAIKTSSVFAINYSTQTSKKCITLTAKEPEKIDLREVYALQHEGVATWLIQIDNIQDGLFMQIRDKLLVSPIFIMAKILIVVWFVFSFGIGIINKEKLITIPTFVLDWKKFLIVMWATDYRNYDLIDEMLWPALFHGAESMSTLIFETGSNIFGTSMDIEQPFEYFDNIINMITSKEIFLKLMSVATHSNDGVALWFFLYFPLIFSSCVKLFKAVVVPIGLVCMTIFGVGQIMMLMPLYALMSFFKKTNNLLKETMLKLVKEFVHFALELGFFGVFIGLVYAKFLNAVDFEVCWKNRLEINFFYLFKFKWSTWWMTAIEYGTLKGFWSLIMKAFILSGICFILEYAVKISTYLADKICSSGGLGLGLKNASMVGTQIFDLGNKILSSAMQTGLSIFTRNGSGDGNSGSSGSSGGGGGGSRGSASDPISNPIIIPRGSNIPQPQYIPQPKAKPEEKKPEQSPRPEELKQEHEKEPKQEPEKEPKQEPEKEPKQEPEKEPKQEPDELKDNKKEKEKKSEPSTNVNSGQIRKGAIDAVSEADELLRNIKESRSHDAFGFGTGGRKGRPPSRSHDAFGFGTGDPRRPPSKSHDAFGFGTGGRKGRPPSRSHDAFGFGTGDPRRPPSKSHDNFSVNRDNLAKEQEDIGAGLEGGLSGLKESKSAGLMTPKKLGLDMEDAGLKDPIAGQKKPEDEQPKKPEVDLKQEKIEEKKKKLEDQQKMIEEIKKKQQEEEKKKIDEAEKAIKIEKEKQEEDRKKQEADEAEKKAIKRKQDRQMAEARRKKIIEMERKARERAEQEKKEAAIKASSQATKQTKVVMKRMLVKKRDFWDQLAKGNSGHEWKDVPVKVTTWKKKK